MSRLEQLITGVLVVFVCACVTVFGLRHWGHQRYDAGYAAAVAAGQARYDRDAAAALKAETDLRAKLQAKDDEANEKERTYEISLEVAQRRMLDGSSRLRCPAASSVHPTTATEDRPVAAGTPADGQGPVIVPDAAADLLGIAADAAGLVRRYERVVERFEACRALNAEP